MRKGGFDLEFIAIVIVVVLALGILEKLIHDRHLKKLPIRININGTRGKSTVTRLITSVLAEAGYKVVGKTTGTSARVIYWFKEEERPLIRGPLGPNIIEQRGVVSEAAALGAEAFVTECMAVTPDYQITFQEQLAQATIGVIVNVREDHLDLCGPTLDNIAESFLATIPYNGHLIISDGDYNTYFTNKALERNTKTIIAYESKVPARNYLNKFTYIIFPENVALAMAVAEALNIDEKTALAGILKARPDPGALQILSIGDDRPAYFVNAFAANDPSSTLMIWKHISTIGYPVKDPIVVLNCRADRVDRTLQYAESVFPNMDIGILVVLGQITKPITEAMEKGKFKPRKYLNFEGVSTESAFEQIKDQLSNRVIFCIGNIHGSGEEFIALITTYALELMDSKLQ